LGKEEAMKRILRFKKRTWVLAGVAAVAAVTAVGGYAYWTNGGSGSGTAQIGTTTDNLTIEATGWANLVPGSSKQVDVRFNNPNSFSSHVKKVVLNPGHAGVETDGTADGIDTGVASIANGSRCLSSWFHYTDATINDNVAPNAAPSPYFLGDDGVTLGTGAKLAMDNLTGNTAADDQNGCKSASVKLYLIVDNS
jgi:hypothetical protein